jgi:hypothetical protein
MGDAVVEGDALRCSLLGTSMGDAAVEDEGTNDW